MRWRAGGKQEKRAALWLATRHLSLDHLPEALCRRQPDRRFKMDGHDGATPRAHKVSDKWRAQEGLPTSQRRAQRSDSALACESPFVVRPFVGDLMPQAVVLKLAWLVIVGSRHRQAPT